MAAFEACSFQSDPMRNKHKDHVVPARYGIICKCDYEGKKRNSTKLRIDMTLFKRFLHRALLFIPAKNFVRELSIIFIHHFVLKSTVLHSILLFSSVEGIWLDVSLTRSLFISHNFYASARKIIYAACSIQAGRYFIGRN